jgi:HAD superfamily phosphoserine phosphatase-like hydrolase
MLRRRAVEPPDEETRAHLAGAASAAAADVEAPPAVEPDPTGAAFFDVDNTMMMGASLFWFARGLAARKYFTTRDLAQFAWQQAKFRLAGNESSDELMADRIWTGTRVLAQKHLDAGQRVWLVTATPVELAAIIAKRLGLTGALGTVAEVKEGRYTGRLVGELMHGEAKAEAVRALAEREGLELERCTAYSDSSNDLPMLTEVGTAVAVNPDTELRAIARSRGWTVRDFRTGRKAARIGIPTVAVAAASGGLVGGAIVLRRNNKWPFD